MMMKPVEHTMKNRATTRMAAESTCDQCAGVYICDERIGLCNEIIEEELHQSVDENVRLRKIPQAEELHHIFNQYVIGQDWA
jgi:ATP-dependent protease Clp ATPase subunit